MEIPDEMVKPRWRGVLHQWAAVFALGAGVALLSLAQGERVRVAAAVYVASLAALFTISAVYHRIHWSPRVRAWLRRADHASIFLLIGGSYTPFAMLAIGGDEGLRLLVAIWSGAAIGIAVALFWTGAPKFVVAAIAVAVGWTIVPFFDDLRAALRPAELWLLAIGGVAYTVGAIVYAAKRPNPWPRSFGYHEVFHALTLVGAGLHLVAVFAIVRNYGA